MPTLDYRLTKKFANNSNLYSTNFSKNIFISPLFGTKEEEHIFTVLPLRVCVVIF